MSCVSLLRSERKWRITIFLMSTYLRGSQSMATLSTCLLSCLGASNGTMADDDGYCLSCVGHEQQPAPSGQNLFVADSPGAG